tara:strand:+ start:370 stop:570 length:201 start_codon:yes stop_codon:yes gene_type:complete
MSNKKISKESLEKVEAWIDLKNRALRLFGKDSVEYIFAETMLDFVIKKNNLEYHNYVIGFMKKIKK